MKKLFLILAAGVLFIGALVWLWETGPKATKAAKFAIGPALPPGKVTPQLVSTWDSAVLLAPDGSLWAWGGEQFALQGALPMPTQTATPVRIGSDSDWRSVSASWVHTLALKEDGSLWGWGNSYVALAQSKPTSRIRKPTRIGTETKWAQVSAGAGFSLALKNEGSLWAWGQNNYGQVGDGTTIGQLAVTRIGPDNDWRSIAAGAFNSYALKSNGTVWGWGLDPISGKSSNTLSPQQIDAGTNWISISASDYSLLALKTDGTLWIYGQNASQSASQYVKTSTAALVQIGPDTDWQSIYAGQSFFFARKRDGTWWVSGQDNQGQLAPGDAIYPPAIAPQRLGFDFAPWAFATGYGNCVMLAKDGTLWSWGERLGSRHSGAWEQMKNQLNNILAKIPGHPRQFPKPQPKIDLAPYKLWELPGAVRGNASNEKINAP